MFIHFTFYQYKDDINTQCKYFIDYILSYKRLKVSKCMEFIPVFSQPNPNNFQIDINHTKKLNEKRIDNGDSLKIVTPFTSNSLFTYLPEEVNMICFIKIPFNKLKSSDHHITYGKLGIAFSDNFLGKLGLKKVLYYDEHDLLKDKLIKEFNRHNYTEKRKLKLIRRITTYRKPKILFKSFQESVVYNFTKYKDEIKEEYWTYKRYPLGYNFANELEWRIAYNNDIEFQSFDEKDVLLIITPNEVIKNKILNYCKKNWGIIPEIRLFLK